MMNQRMMTVTQMDPFVGKYFSVEYVRKNILGQTNKDMREIDKQNEKEIYLLVLHLILQKQYLINSLKQTLHLLLRYRQFKQMMLQKESHKLLMMRLQETLKEQSPHLNQQQILNRIY